MLVTWSRVIFCIFNCFVLVEFALSCFQDWQSMTFWCVLFSFICFAYLCVLNCAFGPPVHSQDGDTSDIITSSCDKRDYFTCAIVRQVVGSVLQLAFSHAEFLNCFLRLQQNYNCICVHVCVCVRVCGCVCV